MAILDYPSFQGRLPIVDYTIDFTDNAQSSRSIGGSVYRVARGPMLWHGSIQLRQGSFAESSRSSALISQIRQIGNYFLFCPIKNYRPASWNAQENYNSVRINGVQSSGYFLELSGLPALFEFKVGDYISFPVGNTHRLYQIVVDATASSTGAVTVKLNMPMSVGSLPEANAAVRVVMPLLTCVYNDGSYSTGSVGISHTTGSSFTFQQALFV